MSLAAQAVLVAAGSLAACSILLDSWHLIGRLLTHPCKPAEPSRAPAGQFGTDRQEMDAYQKATPAGPDRSAGRSLLPNDPASGTSPAEALPPTSAGPSRRRRALTAAGYLAAAAGTCAVVALGCLVGWAWASNAQTDLDRIAEEQEVGE